MKNSKRTPHTLRGAVLIMVMTVMFVLIFLLAGTIAVVYSAHNRAMVKYEESQAYYTARSMLDAYLETFLKDNENVTGDNSTTAVKYYYIDNTNTLKDDKNAKQGRAMELDIYSLKVSVAPLGAGGLPEAGYPYDGSESLFSTGGYVNDKYLYDWVKQYILDLMLGDFTVPAGKTLEQFRADQVTANATGYGAARELALSAINSDINDYKHAAGSGITDPLDIVVNAGKNYDKYYKQFTVSDTTDTIYYRVPANTFKSYGTATTGGSYGKVADTFADGKTDAVIKVQLLERTFNLSKDGADFKMKFDGGNREKDHVKIKVTCEIMLDGVATTTSVIYANEYIQKPSSSKAIVSLSDIKGSDSVTAFGGVVSMATEGFNWTNNSGTSGNVYLRSDVNFGTTTPKVVLNKNNVFYTDKKIIVGNNAPSMTYVESGATYFGQSVEVGQQGLGAGGHEVNVICEEFKYTQVSGGNARVVGQLFTEDFDATAGMGNNTPIVDGDIYTNYLMFNEADMGLVWDNSTSPAALKLTIDGKPDGTNRDSNSSFSHLYSGSLNVAKGIKVKLNDGMGTVITADINGTVINPADSLPYNVQIGWAPAITNITLDTTKEVKATNRVLDSDNDGTPDPDSTAASGPKQDFEFDNTTKVRKFKMPANLIGKTGSDGNVVEIDTLEKMYSDYFKSAPTTTGTYQGDPFAYYGDFNDSKGSTTYNEASHMSDFDSIDSNGTINPNLETFIDEHIVQPQDRNNKVDNTGLAIPSCFNALVAQTTTDTEILSAIPAGKNIGGIITADCQIPSKAQMNVNNVYNPIDNWVFVIDTRSGPVNLQMGNGSGGTFAGNFVVVGTNKCTVLMPATSAGTEFVLGDDHDFSLFDSRLGQKPANLRLGNATNPSVPPAIDIVVSKNVSKVTYGQHSSGPIQGYVYAPYTKFSVGGGNNGSSSDIHVDMFQDANKVGSFAISVIGSIFCKGYDNAQKIGVAFIDPNAVTTPPGDKVFAWSDVYYQRGE